MFSKNVKRNEQKKKKMKKRGRLCRQEFALMCVLHGV